MSEEWNRLVLVENHKAISNTKVAWEYMANNKKFQIK